MDHCKCYPLVDFIKSAGDDASSKKRQFAIKMIKKPKKNSAAEAEIKHYEPIDISECDHEVIDRELELIEIDKIRKDYFREKAR
jgi:hypothetical protein